MPDELIPDVSTDRLRSAYEEVKTSPSKLKIVVVAGETGRGKTYAVQRLFDELAEGSDYWRSGLAPTWPPTSLRELRNQRKVVVPPDELRDPTGAPDFIWVAASGAPAEGSAVVDQAHGVLAQFQRPVEDALRTRSRKVETTRLLTDIAVEGAIEMVADSIPLLPQLKTLAEKIVQGRAVLQRGNETFLEEIRKRTFKAAQQVQEEAQKESLPLVVVLDDAQSIDASTLYMVSGLIGDVPGETEGTYFQPDIKPPMPTLVIATVWSHRLAGSAFADPFTAWLDEAENDGADVTRLDATEATRATAEHLIDDWDSEVDRAMRTRMIDHLALSGEAASVVPLVLAECVALLEEGRNPFTGSLILDENTIDRLPTSPQQHAKDRFESLSQEDRQAAWALSVIAQLGPQVPVRAVESLVGASVAEQDRLAVTDGLLATLRAHGLAESARSRLTTQANRPPDDLVLLRLDPDVQRFLREGSTYDSRNVQTQTVAAEVLAWWFRCLPSVVCGMEWFAEEQPRIFGPLAQAALAAETALAPEVHAFATALVDPDAWWPNGGDPDAGALAIALGAPISRLVPEDLEAVVRVAASKYCSSTVLPMLSIELCDEGYLTTKSALEASLIRGFFYSMALGTWADAFESCSPEHAAAFAQVSSARSEFNMAMAVLRPYTDDPALASQYHLLRARKGEVGQAMAELDGLGRSIDAILAKAELLRSSGQPEAALSVLRDTDEVDDPRITLAIAQSLTALERPEEALRLLRRRGATDERLARQRAVVLLKLERPEEALDSLSHLVAGSRHSDLLRGRALARLSRHSEAVREWARHPGYFQAVIELSRVLTRGGEPLLAASLFADFPPGKATTRIRSLIDRAIELEQPWEELETRAGLALAQARAWLALGAPERLRTSLNELAVAAPDSLRILAEQDQRVALIEIAVEPIGHAADYAPSVLAETIAVIRQHRTRADGTPVPSSTLERSTESASNRAGTAAEPDDGVPRPARRRRRRGGRRARNRASRMSESHVDHDLDLDRADVSVLDSDDEASFETALRDEPATAARPLAETSVANDAVGGDTRRRRTRRGGRRRRTVDRETDRGETTTTD